MWFNSPGQERCTESWNQVPEEGFRAHPGLFPVLIRCQNPLKSLSTDELPRSSICRDLPGASLLRAPMRSGEDAPFRPRAGQHRPFVRGFLLTQRGPPVQTHCRSWDHNKRDGFLVFGAWSEEPTPAVPASAPPSSPPVVPSLPTGTPFSGTTCTSLCVMWFESAEINNPRLFPPVNFLVDDV